MKMQEARSCIEQELQLLYGTFLELGVSGSAEAFRWPPLRRQSIRHGRGTAPIRGSSGISMTGQRLDVFSRERLIEVIRDVYVEKQSSGEEFVLDLDDEAPAAELTPQQARTRLDELLQKGTPEALEEARSLYPCC